MATLSELAEGFETEAPRGEYVVVVAPRGDSRGAEANPEAVRSEYRRALAAGLDRREALRATARRLGIRRRQVFDLLATDSEIEGD